MNNSLIVETMIQSLTSFGESYTRMTDAELSTEHRDLIIRHEAVKLARTVQDYTPVPLQPLTPKAYTTVPSVPKTIGYVVTPIDDHEAWTGEAYSSRTEAINDLMVSENLSSNPESTSYWGHDYSIRPIAFAN